MKIAMVIAHEKFRDEEYLEPLKIFQDKGLEVVTVSTDKSSPAIGKFGKTATVDLLLSELNPSEYAAVLFVGGPGARIYVEDPNAHKVARDTLASGKVLGAICMAPLILAYSGVLEGKNATVFPSDAKELQSKNVYYSAEAVVVDGALVTADGPQSATAFANEVVEMLALNVL